MYPNCMAYIKILAHSLQNILFDKVDLLRKMPKSKKGENSVKYLQNSANNN